MDISLQWYLPIAGIVIGFIAGLFGVGGGFLIIPVLLYYFDSINLPQSVSLHCAIATSLAVIIFNAISGSSQHWQKGAIRWDIAQFLIPGLLIGALIGSYATTWIDTQILSIIFLFFVFAIAIRMLLEFKPKPAEKPLKYEQGILGLAGSIMGFLSAMIGIGGGSFITPYLTWRRVGMHECIAISALAGLPIALAASLGYFLQSPNSEMPDGFYGYIFIPAVFMIGITSVFAARFGAKVAHSLSGIKLKKWFGLLLIAIGMKLAFDLLGGY